MAIALSLAGLLCLAFITWLTFDGLRTIYRRNAREKAKQPLQLVVRERREIADQLLCLRLERGTGGKLPSFAAGEHLLLQAPAGPNGKTIQRAYSIAAWQAQPRHYELGIKLEAHGMMTQWLWQHLSPGSQITVSKPQGDFHLQASPDLLVLIGGGIGITPMRAMLHAALAEGRRVMLFHSARTAAQLLYRDEFEAIALRERHFRYVPIVSRPLDQRWQGRTGRLSSALILDMVGQACADFYLCAGDAMMTELRSALHAAGVAEAHIHWEAFGASGQAGQAGIPITANIAGSCHQFDTTGTPTLLTELEHQSLSLPAECRAGSCGQCQVTLNEGEVTWLLEPEYTLAPGKILPCVCAARTALQISSA